MQNATIAKLRIINPLLTGITEEKMAWMSSMVWGRMSGNEREDNFINFADGATIRSGIEQVAKEVIMEPGRILDGFRLRFISGISMRNEGPTIERLGELRRLVWHPHRKSKWIGSSDCSSTAFHLIIYQDDSAASQASEFIWDPLHIVAATRLLVSDNWRRFSHAKTYGYALSSLESPPEVKGFEPRIKPDAAFASIHSLVVHPSFQKKGFGSLLDQLCIDCVDRLKCPLLFCSVPPYRLANLTKLSFGFEPIGQARPGNDIPILWFPLLRWHPDLRK